MAHSGDANMVLKFQALLREFTAACKTAKHDPHSQNLKSSTQAPRAGTSSRRGRGGYGTGARAGTTSWG